MPSVSLEYVCNHHFEVFSINIPQSQPFGILPNTFFQLLFTRWLDPFVAVTDSTLLLLASTICLTLSNIWMSLDVFINIISYYFLITPASFFVLLCYYQRLT